MATQLPQGNWYSETNSWKYTDNRIHREGTDGVNLNYISDVTTFYKNKYYYYKIKIKNLNNLVIGGSKSLSFILPWDDYYIVKLNENNGISNYSINDGYINFISSPLNTSSTNSLLKISSQDGFFYPFGIENIEIFELDWEINGISWINDSTDISTLNSRGINNKELHCNGWNYDQTTDAFVWYHLNSTDKFFSPLGISTTGTGINQNVNIQEETINNEINYLMKYVEYQDFNLSFTFSKGQISDTGIQDTNAGIRVYLSNTRPDLISGNKLEKFQQLLNDAILLDEFTESGSYAFNYVGLTGNKYLLFVADNATENKDVTLAISDVKIIGGYSDINNKLVEITNTDLSLNSSGNLFSSISGTGKVIQNISDANNKINLENTLIPNKLSSKIGNSYFKSGVWENGIWSSGYRNDTEMIPMGDIEFTIKTFSDIEWRIRINKFNNDPSSNDNTLMNKFKVGDRISVSNIIGIDINDNRKNLRELYTITNIDGGGNYIDIILKTTFPLRRIEKDSPNHRIMITKNVWLSGGFLNGYFKGIWNYGILKGYPLLTKMEDTQWIDGVFDGGHFKNKKTTFGKFIETFYNEGYVGLKLEEGHNLMANDIIEIDKDDKTINSNYDGEQIILKIINSNQIVLDLEWGVNSINESGSYSTKYSSGVIQHMNFKSNNISKVTSNETFTTGSVFNYNSWIDVTYYNDTAINIGKPQTVLNESTRRYYSENNLYGYETKDVLMSESTFRDSFSLNKRDYNLGTKYKIFSDYIGDSSEFRDYFSSSGEDLELFLEKGWTFSTLDSGGVSNTILFNRTENLGNGNSNIKGGELNIKAKGVNAYLNLVKPKTEVTNRDNSDIERNRYTMIEFDLIDSGYFRSYYENNFNLEVPILNFNNVNVTKSLTQYIDGGNLVEEVVETPATYLPLYRNVNLLNTKKQKKVEYFFNKRNLSINFTGSNSNASQISDFTIDNLKFYEINMIPFFKYFIDDNINKSVQVPWASLSPYIDYTNEDLEPVTNIDFDFFKEELITDDIDFDNSGINIEIIDEEEPIQGGTIFLSRGSQDITEVCNSTTSFFDNVTYSGVFEVGTAIEQELLLINNSQPTYFKIINATGSASEYIGYRVSITKITTNGIDEFIITAINTCDLVSINTLKVSASTNSVEEACSLSVNETTNVYYTGSFVEGTIIGGLVIDGNVDHFKIVDASSEASQYIGYSLSISDDNKIKSINPCNEVEPPELLEPISNKSLTYITGSDRNIFINACGVNVTVFKSYYINKPSYSNYYTLANATKIYKDENGNELAESGWYKDAFEFVGEIEKWRYWNNTQFGGSFTQNISCDIGSDGDIGSNF